MQDYLEGIFTDSVQTFQAKHVDGSMNVNTINTFALRLNEQMNE